MTSSTATTCHSSTKFEGKGNVIKTVVTNMADVAPRALSCVPTYPTKFFGCELGSQMSFDGKNERYTTFSSQNGRNEDVVKDCKVCGVNMKHRLVTFILKNPKKSTMSVEGETNGTGGGVCASAPLVPGDENVSGDDSDDELTKAIKAVREIPMALYQIDVLEEDVLT
ncbi:hypothetical protein BDR05DRAFT_1058316 [Suillus weaverae]|nr:hypothetical protein BDR05DRAFT_1058316 [Suillus weaverae]